MSKDLRVPLDHFYFLMSLKKAIGSSFFGRVCARKIKCIVEVFVVKQKTNSKFRFI